MGVSGIPLKRGAPSLWNVAFQKSFFWDARSDSLEAQARGPLFSADEMGAHPETLIKKLRANANYRKMFAEAFGSEHELKLARVLEAIATFERSLVSFESRYDKYVFGEWGALNAAELNGLNVFRSFVSRCTECHTPPLFTNQQSAVIGAPDSPGLEMDEGMGAARKTSAWRGAFKVPQLRNIASTAPYMHSGVFPSLLEVIAFYNKGGGRADAFARTPYQSQYLHWHIRPMDLGSQEEKDLVTFLGTLTDESARPERPVTLPSGLNPEMVHGG